jgi:hypothetical protein
MHYGERMKRTLRLGTALAVAGSIGTAGCENFSATEAGLLAAGLAGAATGIALGTTGVPSSSSVPIALGAAAGAGALAVAATNMSVGRDQRLMAEQRGQMLVDQARQRGAQNIPRYILVDTISANPTGGGRPVMIFDTASGKVASNRLYYVGMPVGPYGFTDAPPGMMNMR